MYVNIRLNGQYTLDNIASCLFGIETNSLQNENGTLINHLKKFLNFSIKNILFLVFCECIPITIIIIIFVRIVLSPRLSAFLSKKGYSMFPMDAVNYITDLLNQILSRRRQHLERRNDFIQIMVDHEEEVKHEEETDKEGQQSGTLKKSRNKVFHLS